MPDGEMCQWLPASASSSLVAALEQERAAREAAPAEADKTEAAKRKPLRTIHDSYAAYSAVAVDSAHNEVVLADENLFSLMTYDRLENTPPKASMSEPKRLIHGMNSELEFTCAVYVDPANGDIYAVNNDTLEKLVVFSRKARGDVSPDRLLETPHTTAGIVVNETDQEMLLTVQNPASVIAYHKSAQGKDKPFRVLQGQRTLLADPHGIAIDPNKDLIFVTNWGSVMERKPAEPGSGGTIGILGPLIPGTGVLVPGSGKSLPPSISVYARKASGDTAPLRVIQGPKTQLNWPAAIAIDPERGELYVANDPSNSIAVFPAEASGDVAPIRVLQGPKTLLTNPTSMYLDLKNDELWVTNFGNHAATVYKRGASGDTAPLRMIRSGPLNAPAPMLSNPHTMAFDSKRDELLVAT
jgi:DNA-binding beta-propeller fold protein YncE